MILTPSQAQIAQDRHRFRVVCCGRRFGKTTLAIQEILGKALFKRSRIVYIAPTYQQARDIAWAELKRVLGPLIISVNESRLEITMRTKNGGESWIALRGWEAVETLRGQAFDFMVVDEVAMMRNWTQQWQEILRPTLTDRLGDAMFISTPKGYNHFYDLFQLATDTKKGTDYASFHFTSYDNPWLPVAEIDKARDELTEESFAQEYLADFRTSAGLVHKLWDRKIHLVPPFEVPSYLPRVRGWDYGSIDPTASVRAAIAPDGTWIIERCYKRGGKNVTIKDHAEAVKAQDFGLESMPNYGDPSGQQWETEFMTHGYYIESAKKEQTAKHWVEYCVEKVNQKLKPVPGHTFRMGYQADNVPYLLVLDTPENAALVKEMELLQWKQSTEGVTIPVFDDTLDHDGHFDLLAALRYAIVSYLPTQRFDASKLPQFDREKLKQYE